MRPRMPIIELEMQPHLKSRRLEFESIAQMLMVRSNETPEAPHVYYCGQTITYKETNDRANQVACFLKEKGIGKGDIVAVMILNAPEIYYAMWGAQKLGAIALPVNSCLKGPEIAYVLNDAKPRIAFVGSDYLDAFACALELIDYRPCVVEAVTAVNHGADDIVSTSLDEILACYPSDECLVRQCLDDPFLLLYSSGTTGQPKGILLSNRNQLSQCRNFNRMGYVRGNDVMLLMLPMFHTNPLCVFTYPMSYGGQALCISHKFSVGKFWETVIKYNVTIIMGVPTMFDYILNKTVLSQENRKKLKIRYAFTGGAPLSLATRRKMKETYDIDLLVGYGLTEGCGGNATEPALGHFKDGSCGMVHSEEEVEIFDDDGNSLPNNVDGEICIKGDCVMLGYLNNPEQTAAVLKGGFLHTGDIGHFDDEGYLYVMDRKGDMIIRGGENIYPRHVELVLEDHPLVSEVAVIGVPDECLGQRVKAFVVPKSKGALSGDNLKKWLSERMATYEIPEFYEFVERFSRTPSGKIQKFKLKDKLFG